MSLKGEFIFTSESVGEGHPDKICDQVSDAVLDSALSQDGKSRVACETFTTTGLVLVGGEITTQGYIDLQRIVRGVLKSIGYDDPAYGDIRERLVRRILNWLIRTDQPFVYSTGYQPNPPWRWYQERFPQTRPEWPRTDA